MGSEGTVVVPRVLLPGRLRLTLRCSSASHYRRFPFAVRALAEDGGSQTVSFAAGTLEQTIELDLPDSERAAFVRLASSESFVPAQLGVNDDERTLSVTVTARLLR